MQRIAYNIADMYVGMYVCAFVATKLTYVAGMCAHFICATNGLMSKLILRRFINWRNLVFAALVCLTAVAVACACRL